MKILTAKEMQGVYDRLAHAQDLALVTFLLSGAIGLAIGMVAGALLATPACTQAFCAC